MYSSVAVGRVSGVAETMLIPLWARATETRRPDAIVRDELAVRMVARIDYDFAKFAPAWRSQLGCAIRARLLDDATRAFARAHPGCVVVNLGCGLDTRFERLKDEPIDLWYDLDLPEAIGVRRQFLSEGERNRFIPRSIFDGSWLDEIDVGGRPLLLISEGLSMYFKREQNRALLDQMIARFAGAELLLETLGPWLVGRSRRHDCVRMVGQAPEFLWGEKSTRDMETWNADLTYVTEWNFFDFHRKRWGGMRWMFLLPGFNRHMGSRITHFRFAPDRAAQSKASGDFKNKGTAFEGIIGGGRYYRFARFFGIGPAFYRKGLGSLRLAPGMRALDLGCGPGALSFALAETGPTDVEIIGVDISKDQIAYAQANAGGFSCPVFFKLASMDETGLADDSVDLVMTSMALHETPPAVRRRAIGEAARVLKPGGRFLLVDWSRPRFGFWGLVWLPMVAFGETRRDNWDNVYPALCQDCGLSLIEDTYINSITRRQVFQKAS